MDEMKTTKVYAHAFSDGSPRGFGAQSLHGFVQKRKSRILWESDFRAMMKIVREVAKKGCARLVQRADKDNPMVIGFYDCGKCAPCLARKLMRGKR